VTQPIKLLVYPEAAFGGITRYDGTLLYYSRVNALLQSDFIVLEYGCGRGAHLDGSAPFYKRLCSFKEKVAKVIGVDISDGGKSNACLHEFHRITDGSIPLPSESIDLCHSDWVVEHLTDVEKTFGEIQRVLKRGGYFCFRTPNYLHYSSLVPFIFHHKIRKLLGHFHSEEDVFPTTYPCNTKWKASRLLRKHGFSPVIFYHRGPSHLMGLGYGRGVPVRWVETITPLVLCHEILAFAKKTQ
jgi:SAM-dependent methyltransferase